MNEGVSIKRILLDLLFIKEQVIEHFKNNEKYMELLNFLDAKDYLDNGIPLPTFKEIEKQTGIKIYHIRKQLLEIYEILFNSEEDIEFDFKTCDIYFFITNRKKHASFKCNNLSYIPRIGENIDLPFVKAKVGCDFFYVDDVRHYFEGNKQSIYIYVKCGMFNSYWYHRLHEAKEKREIPFNDFFNLSEYELKERLGIK